MTKPSVSVVIPTFNRSRTLVRAVSSATNQMPGTVEVIVVDDGSADGTQERLRTEAPECRVITFPCNRGRNAARNAGLIAATGVWIKFLDSDDVLELGSLEREIAVGADAEADVVASSFRAAKSEVGEGKVWDVPPLKDPPDCVLRGEAVPTSAALYRRSYVHDLLWDVKLKKLDDWDYFVRAVLKGGKVVTCPVVSYTWIEHKGQGIRASSMLENAREHHAILRKMEEHLLERGILTAARRERLAQYYYKELRVLCLEDPPSFERAAAHIRELDPDFRPRDEERQRFMRIAAGALGFRLALKGHTAVKRLVGRVRTGRQERAAAG